MRTAAVKYITGPPVREPETLITVSKTATEGRRTRPCISRGPFDGRFGGFHLFRAGAG